MSNGASLDPKAFEQTLKALVAEFAGREDNVGSVECVGCKGCVESTFCRSSTGLYRCHYCVDCERCTLSTHCRSSRDLLSANHCQASDRCSHSSYLVRCYDCSNCTYCFGCVGLVGKDFHILNERYSRTDYFAITTKLKAALRLGVG